MIINLSTKTRVFLRYKQPYHWFLTLNSTKKQKEYNIYCVDLRKGEMYQNISNTMTAKHLPVILLIDNRTPGLLQQRLIGCLDFRCSGFKETQVDAQESHNRHQEEQLLEELFTRVSKLQRRVQKLEKYESNEQKCIKKYRRKAKDIVRDHKCCYAQCERVYGSETSLRNHLRLKHSEKTE